MSSVHRGRASKYLNLRFGVEPLEAGRPVRVAPRLHGPALTAVESPHPQPWRLPLAEIGALVDTSFLDLAKVVSAEAAGVGSAALTDLLFGRDRILASIDALVFAEHDAVLRREGLLLDGCDPRDQRLEVLAERARRVHRRRQEAETELHRQRSVALRLGAPGARDNTAIDDPQRLAAVWLGRYLRVERACLVDHLALSAGISPAAAARVRTKQERVERCVDRGLLTAPVTASVRSLREMPDGAFDRHVLRDAAALSGRDDDLAHPLVVERWLQALGRVRPPAAAAADSPNDQVLTALDWGFRPRAALRLPHVRARRDLFAALVQRTGEAHRMRQSVQDAVTLAEHAAPETVALRRIGDQANTELVRRHRDLYLLIRSRFEPYQTRYGRLLPLDASTRRELKRQVRAALDAACRDRDGRVFGSLEDRSVP